MIEFEKLAAPFDPALISWRVGATSGDKTKGLALAYIDARDVMRRLDEVCGPENWQDAYEETAKGRVFCRIGIRCGDEWIWKTDGAGNSDVEAEKGAISDALKRAAVKWGVGRYLYDMPATWVQIEAHGKSFSIKKEELTRLARVAAGKSAGAPPKDEPPRESADAIAFKAQIMGMSTKQSLTEWGAQVADDMKRLPPADYANVKQAYREKLASFEAAKVAAE